LIEKATDILKDSPKKDPVDDSLKIDEKANGIINPEDLKPDGNFQPEGFLNNSFIIKPKIYSFCPISWSRFIYMI